ncbi:transcription factor WhiB [Williamsia sp. D3]|nr:transcription factor WhiB [Williamsia sp. D3]
MWRRTSILCFRQGIVMAKAAAATVENEARLAWVARARCREVDPDQLFVRGAAQRKAATICRHCPVQLECGADALDNRVEFGVWGGMTERQRRALLRQHPEVTSWSTFFETQRRRQITSVG